VGFLQVVANGQVKLYKFVPGILAAVYFLILLRNAADVWALFVDIAGSIFAVVVATGSISSIEKASCSR